MLDSIVFSEQEQNYVLILREKGTGLRVTEDANEHFTFGHNVREGTQDDPDKTEYLLSPLLNTISPPK